MTHSSHKLHSCEELDCFICNGGLVACEICGGVEASLPSECPERPITVEEHDEVMNGKIDFIDGEWKVL